MNAITTRTSTVPATVTGAAALMPTTMGDVIKLAEIMASAKLVPRHLQGQTGDCFMVIEQALRWNMSPFAVAQATSCISGKLMFEGKLVAAAVEASGAIVGALDYEFSGEGDGRTVRAFATRRGEATPRDVVVTVREVKTENALWKKQPDQQLVYSASRIWARRWTPAVILGVYSPEEMSPEPYREPPHAGTTIDAAAEPARAPLPGGLVESMQRAEPKLSATDRLRVKVARCSTRGDIIAIMDDAGTRAWFGKQSPADQADMQSVMTDRMAELPDHDAEAVDDMESAVDGGQP